MRSGKTRTIQYAAIGSAVAGLCSHAAAELTNRYSFSGNLVDSVGGKNGTAFGQASVSGGALSLSGNTGTYVGLPGGLLPTGANDAITIETWLSTGANNNWAKIFDFGNSGGPNGGDDLYLTIQSASNDTRFRAADGIPGFNNEQGPIVTGSLKNQPMMHIVAVYDAANDSMKLYRDATLIGSATVTINPDQLNDVLSYIGRSVYSADAYLNASITEFRIYNHALSAAKIADNYAAGPDTIISRWSGGSGNWGDASKWDLQTAPHAGWDMAIDAGTVSASGTMAARSVSVGAGGHLAGMGTLAANVTNAGAIASTGTLAITGDFTQMSGGSLTLEIGGATRGAGLDSLQISGVATLGGTLTVTLANGFTPTPGQSFDLLDFLSASGVFSSLNLASFNGGYFNASQLYTTGTLTVIAPEPSGIGTMLMGLGLMAARRRRRAA